MQRHEELLPLLFTINNYTGIYDAPEIILHWVEHVIKTLWKYDEMKEFLVYNDPAMIEKIENLMLITCELLIPCEIRQSFSTNEIQRLHKFDKVKFNSNAQTRALING